MPVLHETIDLLLAPPGGLVYHLLILFSLEAVLGIAMGARQRRRTDGPKGTSGIWVVAAMGMLLARLILIAVALAGFSEASPSVRVVPPLERALDTAVTLLLVWILLPWGRHRDLSWFFPGFGLLGTTLLFALLLSRWQADLTVNPSLFYNGNWQEIVWIMIQLSLLGFGLLGMIWRRDREWGLFSFVLLFLAAGHVLQLLTPDPNAHIAGWGRLAQLVAFPLLAVAVYRHVIGELSLRAHELEEVSQDSMSQIAGLIYLIESGQRTVASLDVSEVLARAVREVVRLLKVDICGLVFPVDIAQGSASLTSVYSPLSRGSADAVKFNLPDHPALTHAIKRKKRVVIDAVDDHAQVEKLYILMGSMDVGPLLIQPLMYNSSVIGALLVGNHSSSRPFTSGQQRLCQALSRQVAVAIENARLYQANEAERQALQTQLQQRLQEHQRIQAALKAQLQQSQQDASRFASQLEEMTTHIKRERQNAQSLAAQLQTTEEMRAQLEAEVNHAEQEIGSLQKRLQEQTTLASDAHVALESRLAQTDGQGFQEPSQQARDKFLGTLSQDLRTPMTSIMGYTDLLLGESVGIVSEMQRKFLQRIKANTERMGAMLNDLIGVTTIDSGQLHLEPEPLATETAIQEAVVSAQAQLEEKDLSLHLDLEPSVGTIEADPTAFHQIVGNLLSNACKASPVGGEIGIKATYQANDRDGEPARVMISVTDSGGGITPEDQPRVFDRFYRAEQALIAGLGETGVGLSIVKALVEAHNGQVWIESEMGQGSTFTFALPAAQPDDLLGNDFLPPSGE